MESKSIWPIKNRVVYIVNHSLPYSSNGYAIRTHLVARGMRENGVEVLVLTRPGYPFDVSSLKQCHLKTCEEIEGIRYLHLKEPNKTTTPHEQWLDKSTYVYYEFLSVFKPTVVIAASNWELAIPAERAARMLGVPFCYEVRGFWELSRASITPKFEYSEEFSYLVKRESEAAQKADRVFTLNSIMKRELIKRGVKSDNISLVPNGFDISDSGQSLHNKANNNDILTIGYVGSFSVYEGLEVLIDTVSVLSQLNKKVKLYLVGSSSAIGDSNEPCQVTEQLRLRARSLHVEHLIIFTGRVAPAELPKYFNEINVIIIPRKKSVVSEVVSPIKPLEAAARGKVILLSDIAPFEEFFEAGVAYRISELNGQTIAQQVLQLSSQSRNFQSMGKKNKEWILNNRTAKHVTKSLAHYVRSLTSEVINRQNA